jgi:hypothetical protein
MGLATGPAWIGEMAIQADDQEKVKLFLHFNIHLTAIKVIIVNKLT